MITTTEVDVAKMRLRARTIEMLAAEAKEALGNAEHLRDSKIVDSVLINLGAISRVAEEEAGIVGPLPGHQNTEEE